MKKKLLIFAVAGFALASCSSDETTASLANSGANEISFRALNNGVTRAANASFGTGTSFAVSAFSAGTTESPYFDKVVFTATSGTTFTSETKYYWPNTNNLDFYAWQPSNIAPTTAMSGFSITPGTTIGSQPDFVYAVTKGWGKYTGATHTPTSGVAINFRHAESKVVIQLKNTNTDVKITVGNVAIGNLYGTGSFTWNGVINGEAATTASSANTDGQYTSGAEGGLTYLNGTWTTSGSQDVIYSVSMGTDDIDTGVEGNQPRNVFDGTVSSARDLTETPADHEMILIPQVLNIKTAYTETTESTPAIGDQFKGAYISVQLKIQQKSTDAYIIGTSAVDGYVTAMWPLTALTWLPGHAYTYTVDLGGGGYHMTSTDANTDLDPILEGAEIKFVTVTVDDWGTGTGTGVYTGGL